MTSLSTPPSADPSGGRSGSLRLGRAGILLATVLVVVLCSACSSGTPSSVTTVSEKAFNENACLALLSLSSQLQTAAGQEKVEQLLRDTAAVGAKATDPTIRYYALLLRDASSITSAHRAIAGYLKACRPILPQHGSG